MTKPYYSHAGITIYHGDCRALLQEMPQVDLLLTDPPYGLGLSRAKNRQGQGVKCHLTGLVTGKAIKPRDYGDSDWDDAPPDAALIQEMRSKATHAVIWGGNYFELPPTKGVLVWDKLRGETDFADGEMAWTSADRALRIFRYRWNGFLVDSTATDERVHPTQKPLALMKWCIGFFPEAKTVLDPFCGSGTTLVAAKAMGLQSVGIEAEERYCEIAAKRLAQEVMQFA